MDKTPEKSLKTLFAKPELDVKNTVIISWQSNMHAVAWCSGRSDLLICGSPGEMDYGNEAAAKNKEPGNLLAVKDFLALVNRKDRSEILLVFSAEIAMQRRNFNLRSPRSLKKFQHSAQERGGFKIHRFGVGKKENHPHCVHPLQQNQHHYIEERLFDAPAGNRRPAGKNRRNCSG